MAYSGSNNINRLVYRFISDFRVVGESISDLASVSVLL